MTTTSSSALVSESSRAFISSLYGLTVKCLESVRRHSSQDIAKKAERVAVWFLAESTSCISSGLALPDLELCGELLGYLIAVAALDVGKNQWRRWRDFENKVRVDKGEGTEEGDVVSPRNTSLQETLVPSPIAPKIPFRFSRSTVTQATITDTPPETITHDKETFCSDIASTGDTHDADINLFNAVGEYDYEFLLKLKRLASANNFEQFQAELEEYRSAPGLCNSEIDDETFHVPPAPPLPALPLFPGETSTENLQTLPPIGFCSFSPQSTARSASSSTTSSLPSRKRTYRRVPASNPPPTIQDELDTLTLRPVNRKYHRGDHDSASSESSAPIQQPYCGDALDAGNTKDYYPTPSSKAQQFRRSVCSDIMSNIPDTSRQAVCVMSQKEVNDGVIKISPGTLAKTRSSLKRVVAEGVPITPIRQRRSEPIQEKSHYSYVARYRYNRAEPCPALARLMERRRSCLTDTESEAPTPTRLSARTDDEWN